MSEDNVPEIERSSGEDLSSKVDEDTETELENGSVPHGYREESDMSDTETEDKD